MGSLCLYRQIYAIESVTDLTESVIHGNGSTRKDRVEVTMGVRNTLNSGSRKLTRKSLRMVGVHIYLVAIVDRYLAKS